MSPSGRRSILSLAGFAVLALAGTAALAQSATGSAGNGPTPIAEQFIGVFSLARYGAHGDSPTGRISYDRGGRMWAMLFPPDREPLGNGSTPEDYVAAMRGVVAYYGSYTIDEATGRVIHHVEAASNPAWIGDDFVRWYRFEDGDLLISLNPDFDNPLLWARMPAERPGATRN